MYFENWEVTGSDEGSKSKPKYSLLKYWQDELLPALESKIESLNNQQPGVEYHVRFQWDNASPHTSNELKQWLEATFNIKGWLLTPQPSNSPLTNVQDCCLFPSMAKLVTADQGINNGSHYLKGENLWKSVVRVWKNYKLETLAKTYLHHTQMVNAIHQCKGGDQFQKDKKSLHCGIQRIIQPFYKDVNDNHPCGVQILQTLEPIQVDEHLRYLTPDTDAEDPSQFLTKQELGFLVAEMALQQGGQVPVW